MKNLTKKLAILRIAGIIALTAVIVFTMAACGGGDIPAEYHGTWTGTGFAAGKTLVITETTFKGDGDTFTVTKVKEDADGWLMIEASKYNYIMLSLSGDVLNVTSGADTITTGSYKK